MRFLAKSGGGLGDLAAEVALFRAIRHAGHELEIVVPQAQIELLIDREFKAVIHSKPPGMMGKMHLYLHLLRQKWDVMLHMHEAGGSMLMHYFGNAKTRRTAKDMDPNLLEAGLTLYHLSILNGLVRDWQDSIQSFIPIKPFRFENACLTAGIPSYEKGIAKRILTVAPGSYRENKRWPAEHFAEIIRKLGPHFDHVVVVGAPNEIELCEHLAKQNRAASVAGKISLIETCALVSNSNLHIGNDSGLGHVAAANGRPTLAIGGLNRHKPYQQHMLTGAVEKIRPSQVLAVIEENRLI